MRPWRKQQRDRGMSKKITQAQIKKLTIEIQKHFASFTTTPADKTELKQLADKYADYLYARFTNESAMIVQDTPISHLKRDITYQRWIEENHQTSSDDLISSVIHLSTEKLLYWQIAIQTAAFFVERATPLPEALRLFTVEVLLARRKAPTSRSKFSKTLDRDNALASCIYWLTTESDFGIRRNLGIEAAISVYSNSDAATDTVTAVTLIRDALNDLEFKKASGHKYLFTDEVIKKAYKSRHKNGGALIQ